MASNVITNLRGPDSGANRQTDTISASVDPVTKAVRATPIMGAAPPSWIRPDLLSGFSDAVDTLAPQYARAAYHKDALGYVHVKAVLLNATAAPIPANSIIWTMPIGYRTHEVNIFTAESSGAFAAFALWPSGELRSSGAVGISASLNFTISYLAEA